MLKLINKCVVGKRGRVAHQAPLSLGDSPGALEWVYTFLQGLFPGPGTELESAWQASSLPSEPLELPVGG